MKRTRISLSIVLPVIVFVLFAGNLLAQRSRDIALIGKINLKAVLLLHPAMGTYDPAKGSFKTDVSRLTPQQKSQMANQHQAEIDRLNSKIKALRSKIHSERRNHDRQMQNMSAKYLDGIDKLEKGQAGFKKQQFRVDSSRIESSFAAKMTALSGEIQVAEDRLERLSRIAFHVGYTDPEETRKKFNGILNEIRQYTQQIATQKSIQVVLNTSFSSSIRRENSRSMVMPPDLDYSKVFSTPFPREIANDEAAVGGYYANLTSMAGNWLFHGEKILDPFKSALLDNDVFIGGVDLTADVLSSIFRTYKIDTHIGNAIIQSINAY